MLLLSGERCITMAMAAGKLAGKPPRITDNAFKPPTEAAMAMTGYPRPTDEAGLAFRATRAGFSGRLPGLDFIFCRQAPNAHANGRPARFMHDRDVVHARID